MKSSFAVVSLALFLASPLVSAQPQLPTNSSSEPIVTPTLSLSPATSIPGDLSNVTSSSVFPSSPLVSTPPGTKESTPESTPDSISGESDSGSPTAGPTTGTSRNTTATTTPKTSTTAAGGSGAARGMQVPMMVVATLVGVSVAAALGL